MVQSATNLTVLREQYIILQEYLNIVWVITWLGLKNDYRTLIGVDETESDVIKDTDEIEEEDA